MLDDPLALIATADLQVRPDQLGHLHERCRALAAELRRRSEAARDLIAQVRIGDTAIEIACDRMALTSALGMTAAPDGPPQLSIVVDAALRRSGRALRLVQADRAGHAAIWAARPRM